MSKTRRAFVEEDSVSSSVARKRQEDMAYMNSYTKKFLARLKKEPRVKILCSKAYAPYFGTTYTALMNTVPVTVKFDGTYQEFPETIAKWLQDKFIRVTESNVPQIKNEIL